MGAFFHLRTNQLLMKFGLNSLKGAPSEESESCLKQYQKDSHSFHYEHESGQKLNTNGCVEIRKTEDLTNSDSPWKKYKQGLGRNVPTGQFTPYLLITSFFSLSWSTCGLWKWWVWRITWATGLILHSLFKDHTIKNNPPRTHSQKITEIGILTETSKESGHLILAHNKMEQSTIPFQSHGQRSIASRDSKTFSCCHLNQDQKAY